MCARYDTTHATSIDAMHIVRSCVSHYTNLAYVAITTALTAAACDDLCLLRLCVCIRQSAPVLVNLLQLQVKLSFFSTYFLILVTKLDFLLRVDNILIGLEPAV